MKEIIKNKAKELGVDLVSVLNLRDYKSPRSPIPLRYLASAKSIVVLAFKPLAGAYSYQENTWSKMPSYLYSMESAGIRRPTIWEGLSKRNWVPNRFLSRPTDPSKSMRRPSVLPSAASHSVMPLFRADWRFGGKTHLP